MQLEVGFAKGGMRFEVEEDCLLGVLKPNAVKTELTGADEVRRAINHPLGTGRLSELVKPGEKVVIVTSDITRPMPSKVVIPVLLAELSEAGVKDEDISIVFALGSHRKHTDEEKSYLAGEETVKRIRCLDSDPSDFVSMGTTKGGTPVEVFRHVAEADRRICIGNIEYHYFAGYSGGAKAIMPGVSTRNAIQSNHSRMTQPGAFTGNLETNPVRKDLEEAIDYIPIDFIVNVVLNEKKEIIHACAGHFIEAHREGCRFLDGLYRVDIPEKADIVIVSQGGYPKDLNLYQAQKALDNAKHAVKKGGVIILAASCKEGLGERVFEEWITSAEKPEDLIERIQREFRLGGHKAAAIAMVLQDADIFLVSELEPDFVRSIFLNPYGDVQTALDAAKQKLGKDATVLVMPYGGSTLPHVK